ncbi:SMP-LTD domain-containing protein [Aphelenchoides besseyi]|nr:SMP-LTD domain-containing protein [Aphelenchoides besseyi]KAI6228274.1 SMP-LTD domain-containing protein [Aphelenchoides besseyi]
MVNGMRISFSRDQKGRSNSNTSIPSTGAPQSSSEGTVHFEDESEGSESVTLERTNSFRFARKPRERRTTTSSDIGSLPAHKSRRSPSSGGQSVEKGVEVVDDNSVMDKDSSEKADEKDRPPFPRKEKEATKIAVNSALNRNSGTFAQHSANSGELENTLTPVSHAENDIAEEAALNPDIPLPRPSEFKRQHKPTEDGQLDKLQEKQKTGFREESAAYTFTSMVDFGQNVIKRWRLIPLKKYRVCALIALISLTIFSPGFFLGLLWGLYLSLILFLYICVSDPISPEIVNVADYEETLEKIRKETMEEDTHEEDNIYKGNKKLRTLRLIFFIGWMNLLPSGESYSPHTFHVNSLQTVLVRLDGHFLRISFPNRAMLKHGFHTDPTLTDPEPRMLRQTIHDLTNATVKLRPRRLARRRWFSRKYPICIKLASYHSEVQANRIDPAVAEVLEIQPDNSKEENEELENEAYADYATIADVEEVGREPSGYISDASSEGSDDEEALKHSASDTGIVQRAERKRMSSVSDRRRKSGRTIFLFARCAREKERWFHQLRRACYRFVMPHDTEEEISNRRMSLPHRNFFSHQISRDYFLYILHALQFKKHLDEVLAEKARSIGVGKEPKGVVLMNLGQNLWNQPIESSGRELVLVANLITHRVFYDFCRDDYWIKAVQNKIQTKLATIHLPYFIDTLELSGFNIGTAIPRIERIYAPVVDEWGIWVDFELKYEGVIKLALETRVNVMRLKELHDSTDQAMDARAPAVCPLNVTPGHYSDEEVPESPETSPDEDYGQKIKPSEHAKNKKKTGQKIISWIDKVASSKLFKEASELRPIRKIMEDISTTRLMLNVEVIKMEGTMTVNLAGPPSDRLWYSFREPPQMSVRAVPQVGDRSVVFSTLSDWIEKKVVNLVEKNLVLPNADDIIIPVLSGNELLRGPLNR